MNRKDRRASRASPEHRLGANPECPCCNARAIMAHFIAHSDELCSFDGKPLMFIVGNEEDYQTAVCDLGLLAVTIRKASREFTVWCMGETMMTMTPDDFRIERNGPWTAVLASARKMLDARFGPPRLETPAVH
jgi:hypothetical protein